VTKTHVILTAKGVGRSLFQKRKEKKLKKENKDI